MRILVVGLVDRPEFLALRQAAEARGHRLQGCYSTELVIETSEEGFKPRLRGRDIRSFDVLFPWTLKVRKWDWFVAAQYLQDTGGPKWLQGRAIDPEQSPLISPAHLLLRAAEAGFEVIDASFASGTQISLTLAEEIGYPLFALPIGPGVRKRSRLCKDKAELKAFIATRSERAIALRAGDLSEQSYRVLLGAGRVLGCLRMPPPVAPGDTPEDKEDVECPEELGTLALKVAKALDMTFGELDFTISSDGVYRLAEVEESPDRMSLGEYKGEIYKAIIEHIEGEAPRGAAEELQARGGSSISACILSRDGASTLPRLLRQLRPIVDEIIIVAINPSDAEVKAANRRGDRLIHWEDESDFAGAWNAAIAEAQGRFILWLRESDIFSGDDALKLRAALDDLPDYIDALDVPYSRLRDIYGHDRHRVTVPRVFRRGCGISFVFQRCTQLIGVPNARKAMGLRLRYDPPAHRRTKERKEAWEILGPQIESGKLTPTPECLGELGEGLVRAKAYGEGLPYLERALEESDSSALRARLAVLIALARLRLGDAEGCREAARIAMVEEPRLGEGPRLIAESYLKDKDLEQAREWLELAHRSALEEGLEVVYPYWYIYGNADLLSSLWERIGSPRMALAYLDEVDGALPPTQRDKDRRGRLERSLDKVWEKGGR